MSCNECTHKPCCDAQSVDCCSKCEYKETCVSICSQCITEDLKIKRYVKLYDNTNVEIQFLNNKLTEKGYKCKIEYQTSYWNHIGASIDHQAGIHFLDLKCENNSVTMGVKMYESDKPYTLQLWKYEKGKHIFKNYDLEWWCIDSELFKEYVDDFFYGKKHERVEQMSLFDLLEN